MKLRSVNVVNDADEVILRMDVGLHTAETVLAPWEAVAIAHALISAAETAHLEELDALKDLSSEELIQHVLEHPEDYSPL